MAFPASPTFGEIRDEVLTDLGVNRTGNVRKHIMDTVSRHIKSEHIQIYARFLWARRNIVFEVALTAGTNNYEFPDRAYPGNVDFIWAVSSSDETSQLARVANPRQFDPSNQQDQGVPAHWWIENEQLVIGPAPSDEWLTLRIQTKARQEPFYKSDHRCQVDPELLVMRSVVRGLRSFGQTEEADRLEADAAIYAQDVAGQESSDQKVVLGQARKIYPTQNIDRHGQYYRGRYY